MVVVFAAIVLRGRRFIRYRLGFMRLGWSMPMFRKLNALGWPVGMQMGMETASFSLSVVMVGWLGTLALASHQIMLTISQFTFMMYYGMGAAVAVRVSNFKGQGDGQNVRRSAYAGLHIILCMEVVLLGIVFALRGQVGDGLRTMRKCPAWLPLSSSRSWFTSSAMGCRLTLPMPCAASRM